MIILQVCTFDQHNTAHFLSEVRAHLPGWHLDVFCDWGAFHQGAAAAAGIKATRVHVHWLPACRPEMDAAEAWIRWAKEVPSCNT